MEDEAIFTYKLVDGVSTVSHGLFVAKIAGMPAEIIESAKDIIFEEGLGGGTTGGSLPSPLAPGHFKAVQRAETVSKRGTTHKN